MKLLHPYHCPASLSTSLGLLAVRVVAGSALILHGWPKIQNPLGWLGENPQFPPYLQAAAAVAEFGGGIAFILGLLTPLFSLVLLGHMAVAMSTHIEKSDPFVAASVGEASVELASLYFAIALLLLLAGPGRLSADACLFGKRCPPPTPQ